MGVRILSGDGSGDGGTRAVLFCSTSGLAIGGPMFTDHDEAEAFLSWLDAKGHIDPRLVSYTNLMRLFYEFRSLVPSS